MKSIQLQTPAQVHVVTAMTYNTLASRVAESFAEKTSKLGDLHAVIDECPLATFMADERGSVTYVNSAYRSLVGAQKADCLGLRWKTFVHPDDVDAAVDAWCHSVASGADYVANYRLVCKDLETSVHVKATHLPGGGIVGYLNPSDGLNCKFECALKPAAVAR